MLDRSHQIAVGRRGCGVHLTLRLPHPLQTGQGRLESKRRRARFGVVSATADRQATGWLRAACLWRFFRRKSCALACRVEVRDSPEGPTADGFFQRRHRGAELGSGISHGGTVLLLRPIGGLEKTIPIGPSSIIGGDSHDDHLATVVWRIREHDQPVVRLLGRLHGCTQPDHAPAKISSSWFNSAASRASRATASGGLPKA